MEARIHRMVDCKLQQSLKFQAHRSSPNSVHTDTAPWQNPGAWLPFPSMGCVCIVYLATWARMLERNNEPVRKQAQYQLIIDKETRNL